jgi:ferric-chelate reductase [NAD(P)H]
MEQIQPNLEGLFAITYGLYIVTSSDGEQENGMIVNTSFQVTAEPPQVAVSVNKKSFTHELIMRSKKLAVMPLEQQTPFVFIGRFGFRTGRTFHKLENVDFCKGENGCPLIKQHTLSAIELSVSQTVDLSTHTLFIGNVTNTRVFIPDGVPLTYAYYRDVLKGKTPAEATHI